MGNHEQKNAEVMKIILLPSSSSEESSIDVFPNKK
jgi:hypothetical protein